jgi:hypothetical protein
MSRILLVPNDKLSTATTGVTLTDGTANVLSAVMTYTVPDGVVIALPKYCQPTLKLLDAAATEMPRDTRWGFGIRTADDARRTIPIGPQMIEYTPWLDLTLAQQHDKDYAPSLVADITKKWPVIVFNQDETLVFQVHSVAGTLDISECTIEFDVYIGRAGDGRIDTELRWRVQEIGR